MDSQMVREEASGEEYLHKTVWQIAERQLKHAQSNPTGAQNDQLVSMVFAFMALEGYLNYIGEKLEPGFGRKERNWRGGFFVKLNYVRGICGLSDVDEKMNPYLAAAKLRDLRDMIVHSKIHTVNAVTEYPAGGPEPPLFSPSFLSNVVTAEKASDALRDVEVIVDEIHTAALRIAPHLSKGSKGLTGNFSIRSTSKGLVK